MSPAQIIKRAAVGFTAFAATSTSAIAHEVGAAHTHPHGVISNEVLLVAALIVGSVVVAMAVLRQQAKARRRTDRRER
ncbi:MAG: hypothetical protein AAFO62_00590 [Pseudomonadota bacterium]